MKISKEEKMLYHSMVEQMVLLADEVMTENRWGLKPGTYTAKDICKAIGRRKMTNATQSTTGSYITIENELGVFRAYRNSYDVFYQIRECEKLSGRSGYEKAHKWTIPEKRECAVSSTISFGKKKMMKVLASDMKSRERYNREMAVLSLSDGCIRSVITNRDQYYNSNSLFRLRGENYSPLQGYTYLSFKISSKDFEHLYGDCRITVYKDESANMNSYINPYNVRIVIENEDGWSISSNEVMPLTDEYIKIYDSHFSNSYEDDSDPMGTKSPAACRTEVPEIPNSTQGVCPASSVVSKSDEPTESEEVSNEHPLFIPVPNDRENPDSSNEQRLTDNLLKNKDIPVQQSAIGDTVLHSSCRDVDAGRITRHVPYSLRNRHYKKRERINRNIALCRRKYIGHSVRNLLISRRKNG